MAVAAVAWTGEDDDHVAVTLHHGDAAGGAVVPVSYAARSTVDGHLEAAVVDPAIETEIVITQLRRRCWSRMALGRGKRYCKQYRRKQRNCYQTHWKSHSKFSFRTL